MKISSPCIKLINSLKDKKVTIGIIGMGYVGLPLAITYAEAGYKVLGIDIDKNKVDKINKSLSYINHIPSEKLKNLVDSNFLQATNNFYEINNVDAIILCLPTPLNKYREPDLSYIRSTLNSIKPFFKKGQVLSLESTTYPGTTKEELYPFIKNAGFNIGEDFFLVYSPEREDPGNNNFHTGNIPKVLGGMTPNCNKVGIALYEQVISEVIQVRDTSTAEMTKLLENIHRAVNIGLMNELKPLAEKMGVDLYEVIRAASTKPFGFVAYYPGPGLGGHCIPIDPFYLTWKAREFGMHTRFIELAGEINSSMPHYVVNQTSNALNNHGKPLKNSRILILGISYKKNIDDLRESPSLDIINLLNSKEAKVDYCDPFFDYVPKTRKFQLDLKGIDLTEENVSSADAVILAADHDIFDYELIKRNSKLIIDTRGRFAPSDNIIRG
tara:strand:- start:759 stop:2078 length:1320 start_codon:yes stop_codon:yes gene_type:complete